MKESFALWNLLIIKWLRKSFSTATDTGGQVAWRVGRLAGWVAGKSRVSLDQDLLLELLRSTTVALPGGLEDHHTKNRRISMSIEWMQRVSSVGTGSGDGTFEVSAVLQSYTCTCLANSLPLDGGRSGATFLFDDP